MPLPEAVRRKLEFLRSRKWAYTRSFNVETPDGRIVLADLAKFCRAHKSTAHPDTHMAARLDGRREVWLRIQAHLNLTDEQLFNLFEKGQSQ